MSNNKKDPKRSSIREVNRRLARFHEEYEKGIIAIKSLAEDVSDLHYKVAFMSVAIDLLRDKG